MRRTSPCSGGAPAAAPHVPPHVSLSLSLSLSLLSLLPLSSQSRVCFFFEKRRENLKSPFHSPLLPPFVVRYRASTVQQRAQAADAAGDARSPGGANRVRASGPTRTWRRSALQGTHTPKWQMPVGRTVDGPWSTSFPSYPIQPASPAPSTRIARLSTHTTARCERYTTRHKYERVVQAQSWYRVQFYTWAGSPVRMRAAYHPSALPKTSRSISGRKVGLVAGRDTMAREEAPWRGSPNLNGASTRRRWAGRAP